VLERQTSDVAQTKADRNGAKRVWQKGFWVAFYELEFQIPDTSSPHFMTLMDHMANIRFRDMVKR